MSTAVILIRPEDSMRHSLEPPRLHDAAERLSARGSDGALARVRRLPPTRAARTPRSRGLFFPGNNSHSRLGRWIINALCIALAAVSILASAEFAEPVINAAAVTGNAGPALFASTMRAPAFVGRPR
jgi:hypothetical protein